MSTQFRYCVPESANGRGCVFASVNAPIYGAKLRDTLERISKVLSSYRVHPILYNGGAFVIFKLSTAFITHGSATCVSFLVTHS